MFNLSSRQVEQPIVVLNHGPERLSEDQIKEAFSGNAKAFWYRALIQELNDMRGEHALQASTAMAQGNSLAMAGNLKVYEAFTVLMGELAKLTGDFQSAQ